MLNAPGVPLYLKGPTQTVVLPDWAAWGNALSAIGLLWFLNVLDTVATLQWVRSGLAVESNPLMASLLAFGDAPFIIVKIAVGTLAALVLFHVRDTTLGKVGVPGLIAVYGLAASIHSLWALRALGIA